MRKYDFEDDYDDENESEDDLEEYEDDDHREDIDDDSLFYDDFYEKEDMIKELEMSFQEKQSKINILKQAVKICSHGFFWRFYSSETKLKMIENCYKRLSELGK